MPARPQDFAAVIAQALESGYANHFEAIAAATPWRPVVGELGLRHHPRPTAHGSQSAIVVGADGGATPNGADELHCDRLGRVRIRFHWQQDAATCWVRVAQRSAGAGMGSQFLPRIGQEVLVQFIENDIDRPVIVGALYNGQGEGGELPTPGGVRERDADTAVFGAAHDHAVSGQGNLAGGNSPVWHGNRIIATHHTGSQTCRQVILVTHSMGGLVARACVTLDGMSEKIAGVVHGVMPSTGAPVAYRRCKVGMADEDFAAGLVIGSDGREVTAVFSQAPGALQLLPSESYGPGWLKVKDGSGKVVERLPKVDPYAEIYLQKNAWWGLVNERWLTPQSGVAIKWDEFAKNIAIARDFHRTIKSVFHQNTFVYYGAGDQKQASFETIEWLISRGIAPRDGTRPSIGDVVGSSHEQVRTSGSNTIHVGGETVVLPSSGYMSPGGTYETSFWKIVCGFQDGRGDGTVPASSGCAPRKAGGKSIRQQFRLTGFSHEPSYKDAVARQVTQYAITKISALAKLS